METDTMNYEPDKAAYVFGVFFGPLESYVDYSSRSIPAATTSEVLVDLDQDILPIKAPNVPFQLQVISRTFLELPGPQAKALLGTLLASSFLRSLWLENLQLTELPLDKMAIDFIAFYAQNCQLSAKIIDLCLLQNLKELRLRHTKCIMGEFDNPMSQQDLKILDLSFSPDFTTLGKMVTQSPLDSLWIQGISGEHVFAQSPSQTLTEFYGGWDAPVSDFGIRWLGQCSNLETIGIDSATGPLGPLDPLKGLQNLQFLDLSSTDISDKDIATISGCKSLRELVVAETKITKESVDYLNQMVNLRTLGISGISLEGLTLSNLHLPNLKLLICTIFSDADQRELDQFLAENVGLDVIHN